jgi:hypothetical protein
MSYSTIALKGLLLLTLTVSHLALAANPLSEVLAVRPALHPGPFLNGFVYLKIPRQFVGHCEGATPWGESDPNGLLTTWVRMFSTKNGALVLDQKVIVRPDGSVTPVPGDPRPPVWTKLVNPGDPTDPLVFRFERVYDCYVPVLTEEQLAGLKGDGVDVSRLSGVPSYYLNEIPSDPVDYRETDLVLSNRYREFESGSFVFNLGFLPGAGGLNPYLPGKSISDIVRAPGPFGVNALYYFAHGNCDTSDGFGQEAATFEEAMERLQTRCGKDDLRRAADEATKGVGVTILAF